MSNNPGNVKNVSLSYKHEVRISWKREASGVRRRLDRPEGISREGKSIKRERAKYTVQCEKPNRLSSIR